MFTKYLKELVFCQKEGIFLSKTSSNTCTQQVWQRSSLSTGDQIYTTRKFLAWKICLLVFFPLIFFLTQKDTTLVLWLIRYDWITAWASAVHHAAKRLSTFNLLLPSVTDHCHLSDWVDREFLPENRRRLKAAHSYTKDELQRLGIPYLDWPATLYIWVDLRKVTRHVCWYFIAAMVSIVLLG